MREAKWRLLEATSPTWARNSSRLVAIEFLSQITNMRTRIRNVRTYVSSEASHSLGCSMINHAIYGNVRPYVHF